jgi:hypothetical protein
MLFALYSICPLHVLPRPPVGASGFFRGQKKTVLFVVFTSGVWVCFLSARTLLLINTQARFLKRLPGAAGKSSPGRFFYGITRDLTSRGLAHVPCMTRTPTHQPGPAPAGLYGFGVLF